MTRNECVQWLKMQDHFLILYHRRPDGDAVGSAAALCLGLRQLGKSAFILENPETTQRFLPLVTGLTKAKVTPGDTLVTVDVASPEMLPKAFAHLADSVKLRIDHHGSATSFTPLELVEPDSASCAELVWDILAEMGVAMDKAIAEAVYVGASTDTGCFRFANTTAHTFTTAAACAQAGAQVYRLNQELFETNALTKLRMQGWIVDHMHIFDRGRLAIVAIPRAVEEQIGVTDDDMDNISNFPRTVAGVCMAATLRECGDNMVKLSVRAIPGYDATRICSAFGGGGHTGAAGASLKMPLAQAAQAVETEMLAVK